MKNFLKVQKAKIVDAKGRAITLRGVNLGGWLMMEGYILHASNRAEQLFKKNFAKALGQKALADFEKEFRRNFIREEDFKKIAGLGFNCVRLPFNYRLIEKRPYVCDTDGLFYLDEAISWARKHNVYVILDLHAAPGAQNHDWHSDSLGKADLWHRPDYQERVFALWEFLAERYKNEETVAGYDLLNESVLEDTKLLNQLYAKLIKRIRGVDQNHILFIEGNRWGMDLDCLEDFKDDHYALSIHAYQPLDFTFNFVPHLVYPIKGKGARFDKNTLRKIVSTYAKIAKKRSRPVFVGEFGVNARQGLYGEDKWVSDTISLFREFDFHWTYWTYKAVKNNVFPDGVFSCRENPPWVNRAGPSLGWETYHLYWEKQKDEMIRFWQTQSFKENTEILRVLQNACR